MNIKTTPPKAQADSVNGSPRLVGIGPLTRLLRPVRFHLAICAFLSAAGAAAGLLPYIAVAEMARLMIAAPHTATTTDGIWMWVIIGCTGACFRLLMVFLSSRIGHYADAKTLYDIRVRIIHRLGILPLGWFRSTGSGKIKKVMTNDLEEMHQLIAHALGEITGAATVTVTGFAYLLTVDTRMAVIAIAVVVLMTVFFQIAMRSITTHMTRLIAAEGRISAASVEYADGITVVKTFNTGGMILDRFAAAVKEHTAAMHAWVTETRYSTAASRVLGSEMTVLGIVMITGLYFVHTGSMTMANLLPFLIVAVGLPTSIVPAVHGAQGIRKGRMSAGHIESILLQDSLAETAKPEMPQGNRIEFDHVSFSYDGITNAVSGFTAVCEPGTITALVGPSGAGKTTLASLLPRFYDVTAGAIRIGGTDIRSLSSTGLLSSMSLVFQDVALFRDTIIENIRIGRPDATTQEVIDAAKAAHIHHVIEQLPEGYNTQIDGSGGTLSGGERQRLTIARAILSEAPIVILDEATAALDPDSETAIQDALAALAIGKTVIVIAHRLYTIAGADQILVMQAGRLAEKGTHEELILSGGLYSRMWHAQEGAKL